MSSAPWYPPPPGPRATPMRRVGRMIRPARITVLGLDYTLHPDGTVYRASPGGVRKVTAADEVWVVQDAYRRSHPTA